MIAVIQRVTGAEVSVDERVVGRCAHGLCLLVGVASGDTEADADALVRKIINLRIFEDEAGKMNRSVLDVRGELLAVSNFTLLAAYKKGNRPDYMGAAAPTEAKRLYEYFCAECAKSVPCESGIFGADMHINIKADGPVTIVMDSKVLCGK